MAIEFIPPWCIECIKGGSSLQEEYWIGSKQKPQGKVLVQRQGLYYRICCRCKITDSSRYKLVASCAENTVDLGLCVPTEGEFGVDTKIPIKRLGEGKLTFCLVPKNKIPQGKFVPIFPDKPFPYIQKLKSAHLATQDGQIGILLTEDQNSRDRPTGQWSEPSTSE